MGSTCSATKDIMHEKHITEHREAPRQQARDETDTAGKKHNPAKAIPGPTVRPNIGPWEPLVTIVQEFAHNKSYAQKVSFLTREHGYQGWRRIRGDGNCFYRAFGFQLIENIIKSEPERRTYWAGHLLKIFSELDYSNVDPIASLAHAELLLRLEVLRDSGSWEVYNFGSKSVTPQEQLFDSMVDQSAGSLDYAVIRALRHIAGNFLLENADRAELNDGLTFTLAIQAFNSTLTMKDFCRDVVFKMNVDVESVVLKALPHAIGICMRVVWLDRDVTKDGEVPMMDYPEEHGAEPFIHVQLRPGHYDLLYRENT